MNEQINKEPEVIALDCGKIVFVDSTAIGVLVKVLKNAVKKDIELVFYDLNEPLRRLFDKTALNTFFKVTTKTRFEMDYL